MAETAISERMENTPIPLLLLLIRFTGTFWCWLAFVLADCIAAVYAIRCYQRIRHSLKL